MPAPAHLPTNQAKRRPSFDRGFIHKSVGFRIWDRFNAEPLCGDGEHPGVELTWLQRGAAQYRVGSQEIAVRPGQLVLVPANQTHTTELPSGTMGFALEVSAMRASAVSGTRQMDSVCAMVMRPGTQHLIRALECKLEELAAEQDAGRLVWRREVADSLVEALLADTLGEPETYRAPWSATTRRVVEYMHAHYAEAVTVDGLARAAAMSRFHFSRCFRNETGLAPYAYLQRLRLDKAKAMLQRGRPVTRVALEVGFGDPSRFSTSFRKVYGYAPSACCNPGQ